jgi:hypothetical protein
MSSAFALLAQSSPARSSAPIWSESWLSSFEDPRFWLVAGLAALALVLVLRFLTWVIRASFAFAERKQMIEVLQALAKQGQLYPERLERMIADLTRSPGSRRPSPSERPASETSSIQVRDIFFRIGFVLLASSLGFFAAALFAGEDDLLIPACILGGVGLGLSGMGVARREALDRIRADVARGPRVP